MFDDRKPVATFGKRGRMAVTPSAAPAKRAAVASEPEFVPAPAADMRKLTTYIAGGALALMALIALIPALLAPSSCQRNPTDTPGTTPGEAGCRTGTRSSGIWAWGWGAGTNRSQAASVPSSGGFGRTGAMHSSAGG